MLHEMRKYTTHNPIHMLKLLKCVFKLVQNIKSMPIKNTRKKERTKQESAHIQKKLFTANSSRSCERADNNKNSYQRITYRCGMRNMKCEKSSWICEFSMAYTRGNCDNNHFCSSSILVAQHFFEFYPPTFDVAFCIEHCAILASTPCNEYIECA